MTSSDVMNLSDVFWVSPRILPPIPSWFKEYTSQISMSNISFHVSEESLEINLCWSMHILGTVLIF